MSERDYFVTTSMIVTASSPLDAAQQFAATLAEPGVAASATYTVATAADEIRPEVIDLDDEPVNYGFARPQDFDVLDQVFSILRH